MDHTSISAFQKENNECLSRRRRSKSTSMTERHEAPIRAGRQIVPQSYLPMTAARPKVGAIARSFFADRRSS
jgi:hypothetical protein